MCSPVSPQRMHHLSSCTPQVMHSLLYPDGEGSEIGDSNLQLLMQAYTDPAHAEQTELQLVRNTNTAILGA